jgi:hypothetical protein
VIIGAKKVVNVDKYYDLERLWADAPRIAFEPSSTTVDS